MRRSPLRATLLMRHAIALGALALAGCDCVGAPPYGPDAGHKDAGVRDAGQPDAGEPDAGQVDAGVTDGGRTLHATTSGGGGVKAAGSAHSVTLSVGETASGDATGTTHQVQLG